ncbi:cell division protein [Flavobacterium album]|uniref:Cell division protein n=1 Tax=Flavobacterium album TaxID=2175091 RepID=A0A2S1QWK5_9FLAO|nr:SRPBCC family protein [Flavobacterium album]AWH84763.1 cell division protein [Flavobacterium album]
MPRIVLKTLINAPSGVVFDLSRSIDLHKISTSHTGEEAIAGTTSGLIGMGESVTWRAKHFGIWQELTSEITAFDPPRYFVDEMRKGAFRGFRHEHIFTEENDATLMTDIFDYQSPYGIFGRIADALFLEKYMRNLLAERNRIIKEFAEDETKYRTVLM